MKRYRIFGAKYGLSDQLMTSPEQGWPEEITSKSKEFHVEITKDKKKIAFLTRNTYEEAKRIAEDYCSYGTKTV